MKTNPAKTPRHSAASMDAFDPALLVDVNAPVPQFKLKKILVPVDFSDCSKKALQYALPLATRYGAGITLLYVVPTHTTLTPAHGPAANSSFRNHDLTREAVEMLTRLAQKIAPAEISVGIETRHGAQSAQIIQAAAELEIDMIVISTHGRTGRALALAGSVAADVVQQAPCPVLVVREHEREFVQRQTQTGTNSFSLQ